MTAVESIKQDQNGKPTMDTEDRIAAYRQFLAAKAQLAPVSGIDIDPSKVHPILKPHHLEGKGRLPSGFMLLQPPSHHPDVWTDVARMRTLNLNQHHKGQQYHLCPLQFDIVERLIDRYSAEGDTVLDPFGGLMTVPYCAVRMGRRGVGIELNARYFADGAAYVKTAAEESAAPTLFDLPNVLGEAS